MIESARGRIPAEYKQHQPIEMPKLKDQDSRLHFPLDCLHQRAEPQTNAKRKLEYTLDVTQRNHPFFQLI